MNKLRWWFRVIGTFYLLLTAMNLFNLFFTNGQMFSDTLPAPFRSDASAVRTFTDAWMVFVFELGVLGAMSWVASRDPMKNQIMAWVIIWAEVFRGIVADAIWITRGYAVSSYAVFIVIHIIIIVTGFLFIRQMQAEQ